ncbi:S8 family serine peptidase [Micromonospora sp. NPDC050417]|uniref:S8 family serine peptidase n=1 Tax=Micromonospora sp. NPDC050417 TaxID=3364280 RepID=UPI0037B03B9C
MSHRPGSRSRLWRSFAIVSAVVLGITAQPALAVAAPAAGAAVDPQVLRELSTNGSTNFTVYLREKANLSTAASIGDADARAAKVYEQLTGTATRTQRDLRAELDDRKASYKAFWIANALQVASGNQALVNAIAARPEVERIAPTRTYELVKPTPADPAGAGTNAVEWNIENIQAPRVWNELGVRGETVVVANIDTGAQYDHPALVGKYRGNLGGGNFDHNYNFFDPANICAGDTPCDNNGHGTHTMGTMVGDDGGANQIGVAPGAKWIAAKGCETNGCSEASLLASGQWVLAPTDSNGQNPRPDLRPDIVNNSWGGGRGDSWYEQTVAAWRAAGIFPSFSAGNDGEAGCNSTENPGDYPNVYGVGSYDSGNNISSFSGRGTSSIDGSIKPNISAPGSNVRSSIPGNGYSSFNGTSMAAPHVSGAVALVWSAAPALRGDVAATEELLDDTATNVEALACGGTIDDNNVFGEGRLNAYEAVFNAPRGGAGEVTGTVTEADGGEPIASATVSAGSRTATTGTDGKYTLRLPVGDATLTIAAFGFHTQTATVTVPDGTSVTKNFALVGAQLVTVSGKVSDGSGHGWPLYAKIEVAGRPGGPVFTDPFTGRYSFTVPGNATYAVTTTAKTAGYAPVTSELALAGAAKTLDVAVPVAAACQAPGYSANLGAPLLSESFDTEETPAGWSLVNRTDDGGWEFDDPGNRGNQTGGSGNFAIIDSDILGVGNTQDADLRTPTLNLTGIAAPVLKFNSDWRSVGSDSADIDVSTDGGATWANVWHQTASRRGPRVEEIPLTGLAGAATAQVRFRFNGTFAWWWELDNVQVVNRICTPLPGGLVAGFTTDSNTGAALNGVTVTSGDVPADKGVSAATADDPNIGDGFYSFFSSVTGTHPFTATKAPYRAVTKNIAVAADNVKRGDFALKAGRLTVSPPQIESHQPYGSTRSAKVTVTNTGNAPAEIEVLERDGTFDLLSQQGAALNEYKVKGLSTAQNGVAYGLAGNSAAAAPAIDPAWTRVANTPAAVFDNAAAVIDGKVYSVGGGTSSGNERKTWVLDPETNAWSTLADMPTARSKASAAAVGGKLYVIGGWSASGAPVASVDVFDPATGAWSTVAGATNPAPRAAAGTAIVDGKVYLVGGCADGTCTSSKNTVIFDPASGTFSTGADYPIAVGWMSCGGIGGAVYCGGGAAGTTTFTDAFVYDPAGDAWSALPDLPIDLWGAQYAAAGGLLVIAGGVTANSSTITNRSIAYDPATGAWQNLPNAAFTRYRGAGACGAYKVGGSPSSFVGSVETEYLGGLELCDESGGDVSWLSTAPATLTLAPGASKQVTVTLTATAEAGVLQPGTYTAELGIGSDTPYPVEAVSVEMNVSPPNGWGKVQGTVIGESCSGTDVPVKATIRANLNGNPATGYTLSSDSAGAYGLWLPKGKYDLIVAKDGWIPEVQRITISAGFVSTISFNLDPVTPCDTRVGGI